MTHLVLAYEAGLLVDAYDEALFIAEHIVRNAMHQDWFDI